MQYFSAIVQAIALSAVQTKDYNFMINGRKFFDQPIKNDSIQKIAIGQGRAYTTSCLLSYPYFQDY